VRGAVVIVLALVALGACTGSHGNATGSASSKPLDPFATTGPGSGSDAGSSSSPAPAVTSSIATTPALTVGQCFDTDSFTPGSTLDLSSARVVECVQPHQQEVYATAVEPSGAGAPYPGDATFAAFADDHCLAAFQPYTGVDYTTSHYDIANARPDSTAWDRGDRTVICALHDVDFAELTGSARAPSG
jgi:hypothetical protein